jgi:hypothetical protein
MNKKGGNAGLIFSIIIFYSVIFLLLYNYGSDKYYSNINLDSTAKALENSAPSWWAYVPVINTLFSFFHIFVFFRIMTFAVQGIPFWMNTLIFTPIFLLIIWILMEWLRG